MSNIGLEIAIKKAGGKVVRATVGDRYVMEEMIKRKANLGGEQSGHIIFMDYTTTGDGLVTALQVLRIMKETGKPLSELCKCMEKYPQVLLNVKVREKPPLESLSDVQDEIKSAQDELRDGGRVLVRYSGTEMVSRIMIEGEDQDKVSEIAQRIAAAVERSIG